MKRYLPVLIIISLVLVSFNFSYADSFKKTDINVEDFSYKQEIKLPIDTSLKEAKYQPIDIKINFDNQCWAINETRNSVRVYYENECGCNEIESQIYDLKYSDENHIISCSVVFLIPEDSNGKENYFIYYDESEVPVANYIDHLKLEESHYFYEPVSGAKADLKYFKITEDGIIPYLISYEGTLFGHGVSQVVAKMAPNSKKVDTVNLDQFASYTMLYSIYDDPDYSGTSFSKNPQKEILIDGNLMIKIRIKSISPKQDIKTDNIYTYYYCPTENKKIEVNTNHEVLQDIEIKGSRLTDGTYANLLTFKGRSASISNLNVGDILPSLYIYAEDDDIKHITIPPDPVSIEDEAILTRKDDIDLGKKAWFCIQDNDKGKTHGIIFTSDKGFIDGQDDGVQVKALIEQPIKFPGLEVDVGQVYATINSYERGGRDKWILPKGLNVSFKSEFLTYEEGGYEAVDKEADIYQKISKIKPDFDDFNSEDDEVYEEYNLKTFVHFAPSIPFGSMLSLIFGRNYSFIYAEIYSKNEEVLSSGAVSRIPLVEQLDLDFEDKNIIQKLRTLIGFFDWKNYSFFKKITFSGLQPGEYVVRVYRENPLFGQDRKYIGYTLIDLQENTTTRVFCKPQSNIKINTIDQNNKPVQNVKCSLFDNNIEISTSFTNSEGFAEVFGPCNPLKEYSLKIFYKGFLVDEKNIKLGLISKVLDKTEIINIQRYDFSTTITDTWGFRPFISLDPKLTSSEMQKPDYLSAEKIDNSNFIFTNLYPANYTLTVSHKSFEINKQIRIPQDKSTDIEFPAEYQLNLDFLNSFGEKNSDGNLVIKRYGRKENYEIDKNGMSKIYIPPGEYELVLDFDNEIIAKQFFQISADKNLEIVTNNGSSFHFFVLIIGIIICLASFILLILRKKIYLTFALILIGLLIISIISPWWVLQGQKEDISTVTNTYLIPSNVVTITQTSDTLGGEIAQLPSEFSLVLNIILICLFLSSIFIILRSFINSKYKKIRLVFLVIIAGLLISSLALFYFTMSIVTELGVGGFIGQGEVETTIPGQLDREYIGSNWGPGIGFYLIIFVLILQLIFLFKNRFNKYVSSTNKSRI